MGLFDNWRKVNQDAQKEQNVINIKLKEVETMAFKEQKEKEIRIKMDDKFKQIRDFAEVNRWFLINETKEDEENYPSLVYLTPMGKMVNVDMNDDTVSVDTNDGDYDIEFNDIIKK
jgi:hypothetical protein